MVMVLGGGLGIVANGQFNILYYKHNMIYNYKLQYVIFKKCNFFAFNSAN
jgi:hypothetical protein